MEWFAFIAFMILQALSLYLIRENPKSMYRLTFFVFTTLIFGLALAGTGIDFPTGFEVTKNGSTYTQNVIYTHYSGTLNQGVADAIVFGTGWILILVGLLGMVYWFVFMFVRTFNPKLLRKGA